MKARIRRVRISARSAGGMMGGRWSSGGVALVVVVVVHVVVDDDMVFVVVDEKTAVRDAIVAAVACGCEVEVESWRLDDVGSNGGAICSENALYNMRS